MYIKLDRNSKESLTKQVYRHIKHMILNNKLKADEKLPSSRKLASELNISRIVVVDAYENLLAEGYTYAIKGSGHYINKNLTLERPQLPAPQVDFSEFEQEHIEISFKSRIPALDMFPKAKWLKCYREALYDSESTSFGYSYPSGQKSLRKTLADHLYKKRGIKCHEDQIIITSGSVQGLSLLSQYFKTCDGKVILEDPFNYTIRDMFEKNETIYQAIDKFGLDPDNFPKDTKISGIIMTPSHQYPMGTASPISRRIELIKYARQHDCLIVEDDYDSAFRYDNSPVESLHELDPERVIYLDSFSKVMMPSLRIGYMVLPTHMIEPIYKLKRISDITSPILNQLTMDRFIQYGYLDQHIQKMKSVYKRRRHHLIGLLNHYFTDQVTIHGVSAGIHIVAEFEGLVFDNQLIKSIEGDGVYIMRLSDNTEYPDKYKSHLILGYGNLTEGQLDKGIKILHKHLNKLN
ncbi:aminotransferase class I/II-fold pyridoxal phosphate-dependent enzyme [Acidaminobacter sp. JC074]|uniref:MocR-like pyridoxine biosynthesis transcription factor PdxR n=1 Tax=Acidaminobacter sp. JC074 TaxID=2530199 RepID=UPI001F0EDE51